jgi:hypothetical protein
VSTDAYDAVTERSRGGRAETLEADVEVLAAAFDSPSTHNGAVGEVMVLAGAFEGAVDADRRAEWARRGSAPSPSINKRSG